MIIFGKTTRDEINNLKSITTKQKLINDSNYTWFAYFTIAIGIGLAVLDLSGTNIAIPKIAEYFKIDIPTVQWVSLAYILTTSALFLPIGRLADTFGRKNIYISGFIFFSIGALIGGFSPTYVILILGKIIQGIGSACIQANGMAMVTAIFPENQRGKALGLYMTIIGTGAISGPIVGGILITEFGWRSIFFACIPVAIIAFLTGVFILRNDSNTLKQKFTFDWLGALLSSLALIAILLGITNIHRFDFFTLQVCGTIILGIILILSFVQWENRSISPMLKMDFFKIPDFSIGIMTRFLAFVSGSAVFFLMPFYVIQVLGYEPNIAGFLMIPGALCMAITSPLSGRLSDKIGTKWISMAGLCLMGLSMLLFSQLTLNSSSLFIITGMCFNGTGMGIFSSPNTSAVMGTIPLEDRSITSAFLQLTRTSANLIGVALATTVVSLTMSSKGYPADLSTVSTLGNTEILLAFNSGFSRAFLVSLSLICIGFIITSLRSTKGSN
jgi:EmrB/QacA subfamily drug resistance transporter